MFRGGRLAHEVDAEVEELAALALGQHVLDGGNQAFRLQVTRTQAVGAGVECRRVLDLFIGGVGRIGQLAVGLAVFHAFGYRGANLAHQRQVLGQRLVGAFQYRYALLALEQLAQQIAGEGAEHGGVDHADLELAGFTQIVCYCLGLDNHRAHTKDDIVSILATITTQALVTAASQPVILIHHLVGERGDVGEEVGTLCRHGLHVGVLVLYRTGEHRIVHVPDRRHTTALGAIEHFLRRGGGVDHVVGTTEELLDQFTLRYLERLDKVGGEEAVLRYHRRGQAQFGHLAADQVQVRGALGVLGKDLEESSVVDAVIVVVTAVHVEAGLGDGTAADVQHIGEALSHRRIKRLVHEGHTLGGGEVGGAQAGHGHAGGYRGGGVLGLRFDEDQRAIGDVEMALGRLFRPVLAHLGRGGNRVGAGRIRGLALAHNHGCIAVHCHANTRVSELLFFFLATEHAFHPLVLLYRPNQPTGRAVCRITFLALLPLRTPLTSSSQTMAPVGQRWMGWSEAKALWR